MLNAATVAQQLGISARAVYELHAAGRLPGYRFGRAVRFDPADVETYRTSCRSTAIRQAVAGSLTLTAASVANGSELDAAFRALGLARKPTRSTGAKRRVSTASPPATESSTPSTRLLLVT